eukprot:m.89929 g.89929  ORF g.89929 m.89929 type:complete len:63 (-) comp8841_c5_seq2:998-1186(-)
MKKNLDVYLKQTSKETEKNKQSNNAKMYNNKKTGKIVLAIIKDINNLKKKKKKNWEKSNHET